MPNPEQLPNPEPLPKPERPPNPEPLYVDDALLRQAEKMCQRRLADDPNHVAMLTSLGQIYRKQGKLTEALRVYQRLTLLDPENVQAAWMHATLAGTGMLPRPAGLHPAPFVVVKDFLPRAFHETLLPFALTIQDKLIPALVGNGEYKPDTRETLELPGKEWDVKKRFYDYVRDWIPRLMPRLHVVPFPVESAELLEVKVRAYMDGHFFRLHMDCPKDSENHNRRVSYVYFFHRVPRVYTGGELLLFDTDTDTEKKLTTASFTRIVPEDNSIVFFPSGYYHSVVPVRCPTKQFADGRFVINGHVSDPLAPKPAADVPADVPVTIVPAETGPSAAAVENFAGAVS